MSRWRAVIFDLDGTLINSWEDLAISVNWVREQLQGQPLPHDIIRANIGDGLAKLLERSLVDLNNWEMPQAIQLFKRHYSEQCIIKTGLYPDTESVLQKLAPNHTLFVVTNKGFDFSEKILLQLGVLSYFREIVGGDSLADKKPSPIAVFHFSEKYLIPANQILVIGDHYTDLAMAQAAGCQSVFCEFGFGEDRGLPCNFRIKSMKKLLTIFELI